MNWIEKDIDVTSTDHEVFPHEHNFSIENFKVEETSNTISTVGQLLTANHVLYDIPTLMTPIPITSQAIEEVAINEVAIHFDNIQKIYVNNQLDRIQLRELKESSRRLFMDMLKENSIHPFVKELYFLKKREPLEDRYINISRCEKIRYKVLKQRVPRSSIKVPEEIINFVKDTFCNREKVFTILPIGWKLSDKLLELEALKLLSEVSDSLFIQVDADSNKVLYLEIIIK
ncbi:hypothetical protein B0G93_10676 [Bacillus sp. V-88]|nr:hypothetical protein B1B00_08610 [Bacillus sp. DSM 27956]PRX77043.1 hypothetical protein B0G93_10676 [Bacillus sp. V-88]SLK21152.1 hypothetical protein SAMN06295884_10676 [Bacillus sp. V-88]